MRFGNNVNFNFNLAPCLSGRRLTRVIEVYGGIEILITGLLRTFL